MIMILVALGAGINAMSANFSLTFGRYANGKQCFKLNGEVIAPVVITKIYRETKKEDIIRARNDGFNIIYTAVEDVNEDVFKFLDTARILEMPVIIELTDFSMGELLRSDESLNMKFSPDYPEAGKYIHYFPDYLNPRIREWQTNHYRELTSSMLAYLNDPVIAFSIGAYDHYHIPDAERHSMFSSVRRTKAHGEQTWLPYGKYVEVDYRSYLAEHGILAEEVGFKCISDVVPPNDSSQSRNALHWLTWIRYRRKYVMDYVGATVAAIKSAAPDMPVTGTFDINFSINDDFASPIVDIDDIFDFVILYYYAIGDVEEKVIPGLLECVSHHFDRSDTPSITMYEFSSTVGKGPTTTQDYLVESLPYVSGFHFQFYDVSDANRRRYAEFVSLIEQFNLRHEWSKQPPKAKLAVYISTEDVYVWDKAYYAGLILNRSGIPYDVIYALDYVRDFRYLYISDGQFVFEAAPESKAALENYVKQSGEIIDSLEETTLNRLKE